MKIKTRIFMTYIYFLKNAKKLKYTNRYYRDRRLNERLSSLPYISGDTFRNSAQIILNKGTELEEFKGKSMFWDRSEISFNELQKMITKIEKKQEPILIIHNGDEELRESEVSILKENFSQLYSTNYLGSDDKIEVIPIGIENRYINMHGDYSKISREYAKTRDKILVNFNPFTNEKMRIPLMKHCLDNAEIFEVKVSIKKENYFSKLGSYRFVLSPPGNGLDCHRTWEAIYCKTIPIVFRNSFPVSFDELPVLIIDQIEDLKNMGLKDMNDLYQKLIKKDDKKAYFKYWENRISKKSEFL
jgi:hypothetical protein